MEHINIDLLLDDVGIYTCIQPTLNPAIFDLQGVMFDHVHQRLHDIVHRLIPTFDPYSITVHDVVLVGSNATYVYNQFSDLDIHVVGDYTGMTAQIINQLLRDFYTANSIGTVAGYEVEIIMSQVSLYQAVSDGVYSINKNSWVKKPSKNLVFDLTNIRQDLEVLVEIYQRAIECQEFLPVQQHVRQFRGYVRQALNQEGYTSSKFVALKILRNRGLVKNLYHHHDQLSAINTV